VAAAVCWRYIEDEYLTRIVQDRGRVAECSLCEQGDEKAFSPDDFSDVLDLRHRVNNPRGQRADAELSYSR
jgi:hypothetical protein